MRGLCWRSSRMILFFPAMTRINGCKLNSTKALPGRGSNMVALADAVHGGRIPNAEISVVVSDQANAAGLVKAKERGIETLVIERRGRPREEHDREIVEVLRARNVDLVCLAGYLRI